MARGTFNRHRCTPPAFPGLGCRGTCTQGWLGSTGLSDHFGLPPGQHSLRLRNGITIPVVLNLNHHFPLE